MKRNTGVLIGILTIGLMMSCEDKDDAAATISGEIHAKVMFMNYVAGMNATMIMAYIWEGTDWTTAQAAGTVANGMFSVSLSDTIGSTEEVEFTGLAAGTYYCAVFETSKMSYDTGSSGFKSVGYYNTTESDYNHMMTPTGITVDSNTPVELSTMMAMSTMSMKGGPQYNESSVLK